MSAIYADLIAAQSEMPELQKTAINPHFGHRYVPLQEVLTAVVPILNAHNIALLQQPTTVDGQPALKYRLVHASGEEISDTMLLMSNQQGPQGQGSAITYARRYSLMSLLGLAADADEDEDGNAPGPKRPAKNVATKTAARPPAQSEPGAASDAQRGKMFATFGELAEGQQHSMFVWMEKNYPHTIVDGDGKPHFGRLTKAEAVKVIDAMEQAAARAKKPAEATS